MTVNHLANGSILHEGPAAEEFISGLCQEGKFIIPKVGDLYGIGGKPPADPPAQILVLSEPYGHRYIDDGYQLRAWVEFDCLYLDHKQASSYRLYWWKLDWDARGEEYVTEQKARIIPL